MGTYDFESGRRRVEAILNSSAAVPSVITKEKNLANAYHIQVTAVYVNIRNSLDLLYDEDHVKSAKIIRCYTSEVMAILGSGEKHSIAKEVGIREDCVYAVYLTADPMAIQEIVNRLFYVNTYIKMLNKLLIRAGIVDHLRIGIGMATGKELVIKGGKKSTGLKTVSWTGTTMPKAFNLSTLGSKNHIHPIVICGKSHNLISDVQKRYFLHQDTDEYDDIYHSKAMLGGVVSWLNEGMPE